MGSLTGKSRLFIGFTPQSQTGGTMAKNSTEVTVGTILNLIIPIKGEYISTHCVVKAFTTQSGKVTAECEPCDQSPSLPQLTILMK